MPPTTPASAHRRALGPTRRLRRVAAAQVPVFLYVLYGSAHYLQVGAVSVLSLVTQGTVASMRANYTVSTTSTATGPVAPGVYVVSQAQYLGLMARAHAPTPPPTATPTPSVSRR